VIVTYNDNTAPVVSSIVRQSPSTTATNATSVTFRVTFNENVSNVDATDFSFTGSTVTGVTLTSGSISNVNVITPNSVYDVVVNVTGATGGSVALSFAGGQNIVDESNNAYANSITSNQSYSNVDNVAPASISAAVLVAPGPITGTAIIGNTVNLKV